MWVFVNCLIENPTFDSQTKENMTLQKKSFGSQFKLPEKFCKVLSSLGIADSAVRMMDLKAQVMSGMAVLLFIYCTEVRVEFKYQIASPYDLTKN